MVRSYRYGEPDLRYPQLCRSYLACRRKSRVPEFGAACGTFPGPVTPVPDPPDRYSNCGVVPYSGALQIAGKACTGARQSARNRATRDLVCDGFRLAAVSGRPPYASSIHRNKADGSTSGTDRKNPVPQIGLQAETSPGSLLRSTSGQKPAQTSHRAGSRMEWPPFRVVRAVDYPCANYHVGR